MRPPRVRLRRTKGWRLPPDAIVVSRPTRWGNPFTIGAPVPSELGEGTVADRAHAVQLYREWVRRQGPHFADRVRADLAGRPLACWCPLDEPCHADILLDLANPPDPDDPAAEAGPA